MMDLRRIANPQVIGRSVLAHQDFRLWRRTAGNFARDEPGISRRRVNCSYSRRKHANSRKYYRPFSLKPVRQERRCEPRRRCRWDHVRAACCAV